MRRTQDLGYHHIVLGEPDLEFLMPPPVAVVPASQLAVTRGPRRSENIQLDCCKLLLEIPRATVEDPHQRLLIEASNFGFDWLHILDLVALWDANFWNRGTRGFIIVNAVDLVRNHAVKALAEVSIPVWRGAWWELTQVS